ncbi:MFS transporter [Jannaschia pagri]|uniref:MFS transporter n=1 Tax=Jannaschia pagri TaxID=2829797 RepID=A0ABQ4NLK5_9RHOB|nr:MULTISPECIES: BCD family MFS transporter [unclassified Jannaschia]GIT91387.1 MFS transporter [Jannaschia sp. AI_61]GIT95221.1 MFS transporter [Jannaschia sp. AI_62]
MSAAVPLGWAGIGRLCLVNAAIGGMSALPLNLFNRLMTVELALPATLSGFLIALHYGVQLSRPAWGYRSDRTQARVPVIIGGMVTLCLGMIAAAWAVGLPTGAALLVWVLAYVAIGLGIGAAGTSFLALLTIATSEDKRGVSATIAWLFLIGGAILTSICVGIGLEPYSPERLVRVVAIAAAGALIVTLGATWRMERTGVVPSTASKPLAEALREVWAAPSARRFTGFVFLSILAFQLSEPVFETFAGHVHGLPPGDSTKLSGAKDGAALLGMLASGGLVHLRIGSLRAWAIVGCILSAVGLIALGAGAPLIPGTVTLGLGNGLFAVGAIGSMMRLASANKDAEGTTMGVFGAAQAIASGIAVIAATTTLDLLRTVLPDGAAYGTLFTLEAILFLAAALMAARVLGATPAPIPGE